MFGSDCALMTLKASCFEILSFIATSCVRICNENTLTLLQKSFPLTSGTIIVFIMLPRMGRDLFSKSDSNPWR